MRVVHFGEGYCFVVSDAAAGAALAAGAGAALGAAAVFSKRESGAT